MFAPSTVHVTLHAGRRARVRRWRSLIAFVVLLIPSCSEPTRAPILLVAGRTFEVVSAEGSRLPTAIPITGRGSCAPVTVYRVELAFGVDGSFEQRLWYSPQPSAPSATFRTSYTQGADGRLRIEGNGGSGSIRADTLALTLEPGIVCTRYRWSAVAQ